jgi:molecular chaperone GrpE (heat shock protein)
MQQANEIKTSLKREYDLYSGAMAFYKRALKELEQKHKLSTRAFLKKFLKLLDRWRKAQAAIRSAMR